MKKIYISISSILVVVSVLLCGCQSEKPKELETVIYSTSEGGVVFNTNEKTCEKFQALTYTENISKSTILIDILGAKYTGIYKATVKLPRSDIEVYDYEIQGREHSRVLIDTKTNAIVRYVNIPHNENLTDENDHIAFIKKMLGENHNLGKYDYECKTHYYSRNPGEIRSQFVDGFRILEENDRLGSYCFFYTKSKNGVRMQDYITAEIGEDSFWLDIHEPGYETEKFSPILDRMDEVEKATETHLKDNLYDGYTLVSIEYTGKRVFIMDGIPYVLITSNITFTTKSGEEYTSVIQTITG